CATSRLRADASVTSNGRLMSDAAPSLLLASASPRRRELLGALGLTFRVAPADLDEAALGAGLPPERAALVGASAKAAAIGGGGVVVLAADTMVVLDGQVLGKPASSGDASSVLGGLGGGARGGG